MRRQSIRIFGLVCLGILLLLSAPGAAEIGADSYSIDWWTVDGGGGRLESGDGTYVLQGTAGQPDAGVLGDGSYTLYGGFWGGGLLAPGGKIYLPLVVRG